MKTQDGYVLFFCLMLVSLLSFLTLSQWRSMFIYSKTVANRIRQHQQDYQLERLGRLLANKPLRQIPPSCFLPEKDPGGAVFEFISNSTACRLEQGAFYYWIEDLGLDDCLQIVLKNQSFASHHYRYTLVSKEGQALQFYFVNPAKGATCLKDIRRLAPGITSWRHFRIAFN